MIPEIFVETLNGLRSKYTVAGANNYSVHFEPIRRLGQCEFGPRRIVLNPALLQHVECLIDTLKHEYAHAMMPLQEHNKVWQATAVLLGAMPLPCNGIKLHFPLLGAKSYVYCKQCNNCFSFFRKAKYRRYACNYCKKELQIKDIVFWPTECENRELLRLYSPKKLEIYETKF